MRPHSRSSGGETVMRRATPHAPAWPRTRASAAATVSARPRRSERVEALREYREGRPGPARLTHAAQLAEGRGVPRRRRIAGVSRRSGAPRGLGSAAGEAGGGRPSAPPAEVALIVPMRLTALDLDERVEHGGVGARL